MLKGLLLLVTICVVAVAGYAVGSIFTSIDRSLCYSTVIGDITEEAKEAISVGPSALDGFQRFMDSLPLYGYETNCKEVDAAIRKKRGGPSYDRRESNSFERDDKSSAYYVTVRL